MKRFLKICFFLAIAFMSNQKAHAMEQSEPVYATEQGISALLEILNSDYNKDLKVKTFNSKMLEGKLKQRLAQKHPHSVQPAAHVAKSQPQKFTAPQILNAVLGIFVSPDYAAQSIRNLKKTDLLSKMGKSLADLPAAPVRLAVPDEPLVASAAAAVVQSQDFDPAVAQEAHNQEASLQNRKAKQAQAATQSAVDARHIDAPLKANGLHALAATSNPASSASSNPNQSVAFTQPANFSSAFASADSSHKAIDEADLEAELEERAIEFEKRKAYEKGVRALRKNKDDKRRKQYDLSRAVTFAGKKHRERWSTAGKTDQQIKRKWFNVMMEKAKLSPFNKENVTQAAASAQPANVSPAFASAIAAQSHPDQNSDAAAFGKRMNEYRQRQLEKIISNRSRPTAFAAQAGAASAYDHTLDQPATDISFQLPGGNLQPTISASASAEAVQAAAPFDQSSIVAAQLHEQMLKERDAELAAQLNDEQVAQQLQKQFDDEVRAQAPQQRYAAAANPQAAMARAAARKPTAAAPRAKTVAKPTAAATAPHALKPAPKRVATPKTAAHKAPTASRATVAKKAAPQTAAAAKPAARKTDGKAAERAQHKAEVDEQPSAIKIEMLSGLAEALPELLHHFLASVDEKPYIALLRPAVEKHQNVLKAESLTDATNLLNAIKDRAHLLSDKDLTVVFEAVVESYKILEKENEDYYGSFNG